MREVFVCGRWVKRNEEFKDQVKSWATPAFFYSIDCFIFRFVPSILFSILYNSSSTHFFAPISLVSCQIYVAGIWRCSLELNCPQIWKFFEFLFDYLTTRWTRAARWFRVLFYEFNEGFGVDSEQVHNLEELLLKRCFVIVHLSQGKSSITVHNLHVWNWRPAVQVIWLASSHFVLTI